MTTKRLVRRLSAALDSFEAAADEISRLDAARGVREAAEALEADQVEQARSVGITWKEIGARYGLTKQGAQQRFRAAPGEAPGP